MTGAITNDPILGEPPESPTPLQHRHTDFLIGETKDLLVRQLGDVDSIDTKTSILFGADALIVTTGLTTFASTPASIASGAQSSVYWICLAASLILLLTSMVCSLAAYRVFAFKDTLNPRTAYEKWAGLSEEAMKTQYLHNLIDASEHNAAVIDKKVRLIQYSLFSLVAAVFSLTVSTVILFLNN